MDADQFGVDVAEIVEKALAVPDLDVRGADENLSMALGLAFNAAELRRLEKVFDKLGELCFTEHRRMAAREARTAAFARMTDGEIRGATGGYLLGTLGWRPPLSLVHGGDAA